MSRPFGSPIKDRLNWRMLVPGAMHARWGQRLRGRAFGWMFGSASVMAAFAWGSWTAYFFLAVAFAVHIASVADVLAQHAYPPFACGVPTFSASIAIAAVAYFPLLLIAWTFAWPGDRIGDAHEQYLVDRARYAALDPQPRDWVCFRVGQGPGVDVGRVCASPGDEVEWNKGELRVNGRPVHAGQNGLSSDIRAMRMTVGPGQWLLAIEGRHAEPANHSALALVDRTAMIGRPWAQSLPLRSRRLLL